MPLVAAGRLAQSNANVKFLLTLAHVQLAAGDSDAALATFRRAVAGR